MKSCTSQCRPINCQTIKMYLKTSIKCTRKDGSAGLLYIWKAKLLIRIDDARYRHNWFKCTDIRIQLFWLQHTASTQSQQQICTASNQVLIITKRCFKQNSASNQLHLNSKSTGCSFKQQCLMLSFLCRY